MFKNHTYCKHTTCPVQMLTLCSQSSQSQYCLTYTYILLYSHRDFQSDCWVPTSMQCPFPSISVCACARMCVCVCALTWVCMCECMPVRVCVCVCTWCLFRRNCTLERLAPTSSELRSASASPIQMFSSSIARRKSYMQWEEDIYIRKLRHIGTVSTHITYVSSSIVGQAC